jgi:tripartite-type tricarboxylate transporter receptor subunit TctC
VHSWSAGQIPEEVANEAERPISVDGNAAARLPRGSAGLSEPVRVVIPYPPGGVDVYVRVLMPTLERELGQPWVLDYRTGAGGVIGQESIVRSAPDGYTLLATVSNPWIIVPALRRKPPYDPIADFTAITMLYDSVNVIVAHPSFPANSFRELIEHAKKNPGKVPFATSGIGSAQHIDGENIGRLGGVEMLHTPFQGFGPMIPAMLGGQVPVGFITYGIARQLVGGGKLKIVAMTNAVNLEKSYWLPGVQAVHEVVPGFVPMPAWQAFAGPAGMPRAITLRNQRAVAAALKDPAVMKQFDLDKMQGFGMAPEEFEKRIKAEFEMVKSAIKVAGIPPQD